MATRFGGLLAIVLVLVASSLLALLGEAMPSTTQIVKSQGDLTIMVSQNRYERQHGEIHLSFKVPANGSTCAKVSGETTFTGRSSVNIKSGQVATVAYGSTVLTVSFEEAAAKLAPQPTAPPATPAR